MTHVTTGTASTPQGSEGKAVGLATAKNQSSNYYACKKRESRSGRLRCDGMYSPLRMLMPAFVFNRVAIAGCVGVRCGVRRDPELSVGRAQFFVRQSPKREPKTTPIPHFWPGVVGLIGLPVAIFPKSFWRVFR